MKTYHETDIHYVTSVEYNVRNVAWNKTGNKIVKLVIKDQNGSEFRFSIFTDEKKFKLTKNKEL
jgi:hypothetical protein